MKSIKKLFFNYLILTTVIPLITIGTLSIIISYKVIKEELLKANDHEVGLIVKGATDYLNRAESVLSSLKNELERGVYPDSPDFSTLENLYTNSFNFILGIQTSSRQGIVTSIYPNNRLILGSDITGYEYYQNALKSKTPYWSSSFIADISDSPVVSLSTSNDKYVITLFLSLKEISSLSKFSKNYITISDQKGVYISHPNEDIVNLREYNPDFSRLKESWDKKSFREVTTINNKKYLSSIYFIKNIDWTVTLNLPLSSLYSPGIVVGLSLFFISLIVIILVLYFETRLNSSINRSFSVLLDSAKRITGGNYKLTIPDLRYEEFNEFSISFQTMVDKVKVRENELKIAHRELSLHKDNLELLVNKRTKELNSTIDNLQLTQKQLVEAEKMASLGQLVAGISHEINTPLGIIVTGTSFLEDITKEMRRKISNGSLTKNDLAEFCESIKSSTDLILTNSRRASDLIQSFKQVSADQASEFKREFNFYNYVRDIINSLNPQYKNLNLNIDLNCPKDLKIKSYPGAIAQVFTNLVMNSITHGFDEKDEGNIIINVVPGEDKLTIGYFDDGKGMDKSVSKRIFEPFFTTKRGTGGTGLGMHIVYNIISQKLRGSITHKTPEKTGVEFIITLPLSI